MAQIYSLVEEGTFEISHFSDHTRDIAVKDGKVYPNKSPGSSLIGVPVYFLLYHLQKSAGISPQTDPIAIFIDAYILKFITNDLCAAYAGVLFFRMMLLAGLSGGLAFLASLGLCLGTLVWPYSSVYMGHVQSFSFYVMGFYYLFPWVLKREEKPKAFFIGGFFFGVSALMDYFVFYLILFWILFVLISRGKRKSKLLFLSGMGIPVAGMMLYHGLVFGGPFEFPMKYNLAIFQYCREDLWLKSFQPFNLTVARELLIGPYYGLFTYNPVLWSGGAGLMVMLFKKEYRALALVSLMQFLVLTGIISCFIGWWGGHSVGPRYLIPLIPVLMTGIVGFLKWGRMASLLFVLLTGWGIVVNMCIAFHSPVRRSLVSFWSDIVPVILKGGALPVYSFPRLEKTAVPPEILQKLTGNFGGLWGLDLHGSMILLFLLSGIFLFALYHEIFIKVTSVEEEL